MSTLNLFLEIFLLGLVAGAIPGPVLTAVFTEVLRSGYVKSLRVVFKALGAEISTASLVLIVVFNLNIPPFYFYILSIAGAVYLIWLGYKIWKITEVGSGQGEVFSFTKMLLLTVLNGGFWIFWLTICVPRAFLLQESISGGKYLFLLFFELGWIISTASSAFIFSRFRPWLLKKNLVSGVFKTFAILLVFFALKSAVQAVMALLK